MDAFTITKPGGTKDYEFQAYTKLLEEIGVDVANAPRTPEPGTKRRWLYSWHKQREAEGFLRELRLRTRDNSWELHRFVTQEETKGPVAPLDIFQVRQANGELTHYFTPASRERIIRTFPRARLIGNLSTTQETLDGYSAMYGDWWDQVCLLLSGLTKEDVLALGGYRIILPDGRVGHEVLPEVYS